MTLPNPGQAPNWGGQLNDAITTIDNNALRRGGMAATDYLAQSLYYAAHRGSGQENPEHTMAAYDTALANGAQAIEVSVNITADGTLVCLHDLSLDRTTTSTGNLSTWTYQAVANKVVATGKFLGPSWINQPLPTLRSVLDRFLGKCVIFLEAKDGNANVPLQNMLASYKEAPRSVIIKGYFGSPAMLTWGKTNGYRTWTYVDTDTTDAQLNAVDSISDSWGLPIAMDDTRITQIVTRGKPCMVWSVSRRSERDHLVGLGVRGIMCASSSYVQRSTAMRTLTDFGSGVVGPGDQGTVSYSSTYGPTFDLATSSVYLAQTPNQSFLLGSLCPIAPGAGGYRIQFDMTFTAIAADTTQHAGIAFGKVSDDAYHFSVANPTGGYHTAIRMAGQIQLYTHTAGVTTGTQLGTTTTAAFVAGTWDTFQVDVTPTQVILRRTTNSTGNVTVSNTTYRGGYMHLSTGSVALVANAAKFRNVIVTTL